MSLKARTPDILRLQTMLGYAIGSIRDETAGTIDDMEAWVFEIICKPKNDSMQDKKGRCEICNSKEEPYNLELHHLSGIKHGYQTITVDRLCHRELSDAQKTWDKRWTQRNHPENVRTGFLLLGIHDCLILKTRKTGISAYEQLAKRLRNRICQMLQMEECLT